MIVINHGQDGILICGKSNSINYCDFHYHGITIIPILPNSTTGSTLCIDFSVTPVDMK